MTPEKHDKIKEIIEDIKNKKYKRANQEIKSLIPSTNSSSANIPDLVQLLEIARISIQEFDKQEYMKSSLCKFTANSAPDLALKLSNMGIKQFEKNTE